MENLENYSEKTNEGEAFAEQLFNGVIYNMLDGDDYQVETSLHCPPDGEEHILVPLVYIDGEDSELFFRRNADRLENSLSDQELEAGAKEFTSKMAYDWRKITGVLGELGSLSRDTSEEIDKGALILEAKERAHRDLAKLTEAVEERDVRFLDLAKEVGGMVDDFFNSESDTTTWVVAGESSRAILRSGRDEDLPSVDTHRSWEEQRGETLHIFGRAIDIGMDGRWYVFDSNDDE